MASVNGEFDWDGAVLGDGRHPVPAQGDRPKLHTWIAKDIRERIVDAGWPVGTVLGSEAALAQRYGVSRSVMREAARLLEHQRIASMTRGPSGGLTIREPSPDAVVNAVAVMFDYTGGSLGELLEIKLILETWTARAAAEHVTAQGVELLDRLNEADRTAALGESYLSERQDPLHTAIANQAGNPVAAMLLSSVTSLVVRYSPVAVLHDASPTSTTSSIARAHTAIVAAIRDRDADLAERRMAKHIAAMSGWLAASGGERAEWTDADVRKATASDSPRQLKLAEIVAERIRDDIVAAGWQVGASLGTEPMLLERYSVSRSVFREAVRLLEHHSAVTYRAGNNGGLVVGKPRGESVVDAALSYLGYHAVQLQHVSEIRRRLEEHSAHLAASRSQTSGLSALARHLAPGDHSITPCAGEFHIALARRSGNRALALFVETLIELEQRIGGTAAPRTSSEGEEAALNAHSLILDAVAAGDSEGAVAAMQAHLQI